MSAPYRTLRLLVAAGALLGVAAALPIAWMEYDEGIAQMQKKQKPGLFYFAGESSDEFTKKAEERLFKSKLFLTRMKKVVPVRFDDSVSKELLEKYEVIEGRGVIVLVDLLGTKVARFSGDLDVKAVTEAIPAAVKITEERGKIVKKLAQIWEKGEKAHKKKKWATAIRSYALILKIQEEKEEELPSDLYEQADAKLSEIRADADKLLDEAQALIETKKYSHAKKMAKEVARKYPDEMIIDRAKGIEDLADEKARGEFEGK